MVRFDSSGELCHCVFSSGTDINIVLQPQHATSYFERVSELIENGWHFGDVVQDSVAVRNHQSNPLQLIIIHIVFIYWNSFL
jgi:hypothetical protein